MTALVAHASAHGSTTEIAARIAETLGRAGVACEVRAAADVTTLEPYDAVVLGSAVHDGRWLSPASDLVGQHADELRQRPVWTFSVCSIGATSSFFGPRVSRLARRRLGPAYPDVAPLVEQAGARDHRSFAGVIQPYHWGRIGNLGLRLAGGRFGDHRDWGDVEAWADRIAIALRPATSAPTDRSSSPSSFVHASRSPSGAVGSERGPGAPPLAATTARASGSGASAAVVGVVDLSRRRRGPTCAPGRRRGSPPRPR